MFLTGSWDGKRIPNPNYGSVMGAQEYTVEGQGSVKLWDVGSGQEVRSFNGHPDVVTAVAFSPDDGGMQVLTGSADGTARLWDRETGQELASLDTECEYVTVVGFTPDGKQLYTGCGSLGMIKFWDRQSRQETGRVPTEQGLESVAFIPAGPSGAWQLLTGGITAQIINLNGDLLQTFDNHSLAISTLAFAPQEDGKSLLMGTYNGICKRWDLSGVRLQTFPQTQDFIEHLLNPVAAFVHIGPDQTLFTVRADRVARRNTQSGAPSQVFSHEIPNPIYAVLSPDGQTFAVGTARNTIELINRNTGNPIRTLSKPVQPADPANNNPFGVQREMTASFKLSGVVALAFSPNDNGKTLLSGDLDHEAILWDVETGKLLHTLSGHTGTVNVVAFSPDGQQLVTGSADKTARVWNRQGGAASYPIRTY